MANKYRLILMNESALPPGDGYALNSVNGVLVARGGWNPNAAPVVFKTVFESSDDGALFVQKPDAPWIYGKHTFGNGVKANGWIYDWGADSYNTSGAGSPRRAVHRYNQATGVYELVTADWGDLMGDRVLSSSVVHKDNLMSLGGQFDGSEETQVYTDIVKSATGAAWEKVGDLPAFMQNRSMGALISGGDTLYFIGGAKYGNGGHSNYGADFCVSHNDGATWEQLIANDNRLKGIYGAGAYWDGKAWFMKGYHDGKNQAGLVSINPETLEIKTINYNLSGRHAQGLTVHNDGLNIICGSKNNDLASDSWRLIRL